MKKYPCGGGSHPFIDALIALMEEHSFDYRDVDEVEVSSPTSPTISSLETRERTWKPSSVLFTTLLQRWSRVE